MEETTSALAYITLYFGIGGLIALWARKRSGGGLKDFYVASGRFGWFASSLTYAATTYSAFMIIGLVGLSYATGLGSLGFELTYLVSTIFLLTVFSIGVWRKSSERGWETPAHMLGDLYDSSAINIFVSLLYIFALSPYMAAQLQGLASSVQGLGFGYPAGLLIAFIAALLWTLAAGMISIVYTDVFQGLWMLLASFFLLAWILAKVHVVMGVEAAFNALDANGLLSVGHGFWSLSVFTGFTIPWIFFSVTNPQVIHRLYLPKTQRDVKRMIISFSSYGLIYTVIMVLIGLFARSLVLTGNLSFIQNRDLVTPTLLGYINPFISGFIFTSILAASISTVDSILHVVSISFSRAYRDYKKIPRVTEKFLAYILIVLLLTGVSVLSYYRLAFVVELSVISSFLLLPLAPSTIYAWLSSDNRGCKHGFFISVLSGLAIEVAGILYIFYHGLTLKLLLVLSPLGIPLPLWTIIVSTLLFIPFIRIKVRGLIKQ